MALRCEVDALFQDGAVGDGVHDGQTPVKHPALDPLPPQPHDTLPQLRK